MSDIHHTFTERFLRAQIVFQPPAEPAAAGPTRDAQRGPARRYNALGILEDVPPEEVQVTASDDGRAAEPGGRSDGAGEPEPAPAPAAAPVAALRGQATVVGAGRARALADATTVRTGGGAAPDFTNVGRNDPCPCGSGRKFKKCHGAQV